MNMTKNYDAIILPTGETSFGDRSFPVSKEAIKLFNSGRFGCIFVTGGHMGFAEVTPGFTKSEAEDTAEYLLYKGICPEKIYSDDRALETVGNFTFPIVEPQGNNPNLNDFRNMLVIGKEGHIWRMKDYTNLVFGSDKDKIDFYSVPGNHNNGLFAKVYHSALLHALGKNRNAEEIHDFIIRNHPFYSEGWYKKSPSERKVETALVGLDWFLGIRK